MCDDSVIVVFVMLVLMCVLCVDCMCQFVVEVCVIWLMFYLMVLLLIFGYCMMLFDYCWICDLFVEDMVLFVFVNGSVVIFLFFFGKSFEELFVVVFVKVFCEDQGWLFVQSLVFVGGIGVLVVLVLIGMWVLLMMFIFGGQFCGECMFGYYVFVIGSFLFMLFSIVFLVVMCMYGDIKLFVCISIVCGVVNNIFDLLFVFGLFGQYLLLQLFGFVLILWIIKSLYFGWCICCICLWLCCEQVVLLYFGVEWLMQ